MEVAAGLTVLAKAAHWGVGGAVMGGSGMWVHGHMHLHRCVSLRRGERAEVVCGCMGAYQCSAEHEEGERKGRRTSGASVTQKEGERVMPQKRKWD